MATEVVDAAERSRYEVIIDGDEAGTAAYEITGAELGTGVIEFTHTVVDKERRETGLGSILVRAALDDVRANTTYRVVASCPFVAKWISLHPDYADLLTR